MIAARFRSLWWAAFAMLAGLLCYMVTQYVAGERLALEKVERQIRGGQLAIRALDTELGTRASMAQLERWNTDALALHAPKANQYVQGVAQLASLDRPVVPVTARPVVQVAYRPNAPAAPAIQAQAPAPQPAPALREASYIRPARDHIVEHAQKVAMVTGREPLSAGTLAAIDRIADTEQSHTGGQ